MSQNTQNNDVIEITQQTFEALRQSSMTGHTDVSIQIHNGYQNAVNVVIEEVVRLRNLCNEHGINHTKQPQNRATRRREQKNQAKSAKKSK